jgi:hypothetical protein
VEPLERHFAMEVEYHRRLRCEAFGADATSLHTSYALQSGAEPAAAAGPPGSGGVTREETVTVVPAADTAMLLNPGKGWVQYYGTDRYTKDYITVGYTRWAWSDLEPAEGQYRWKEVDAFVDQFRRLGKKTAFGVMSVSTGLGRQHVTPGWVFAAGASPLSVPDSSSPTGRQIIPKHSARREPHVSTRNPGPHGGRMVRASRRDAGGPLSLIRQTLSR